MTGSAKDCWSSGELYEPYVGRWSRLVAREFLAWLDAPAGLDWLDVGCGTGALTAAVADRCAPGRLAGIDPSAGFLDFARERLRDAGAELRQADAQDLPFGAAEFDRVVSGLVLNFVPDGARAAAEMARVARPGGAVALYVWDYADRMEMMRRFWDAADPIPRGPSAGAGLLHVAGGGGARGAARAAPRVPARAAGRQHPSRRAGLGRAGPQGLRAGFPAHSYSNASCASGSRRRSRGAASGTANCAQSSGWAPTFVPWRLRRVVAARKRWASMSA
jgi:SAM-dependent methyltransferase